MHTLFYKAFEDKTLSKTWILLNFHLIIAVNKTLYIVNKVKTIVRFAYYIYYYLKADNWLEIGFDKVYVKKYIISYFKYLFV